MLGETWKSPWEYLFLLFSNFCERWKTFDFIFLKKTSSSLSAGEVPGLPGEVLRVARHPFEGPDFRVWRRDHRWLRNSRRPRHGERELHRRQSGQGSQEGIGQPSEHNHRLYSTHPPEWNAWHMRSRLNSFQVCCGRVQLCHCFYKFLLSRFICLMLAFSVPYINIFAVKSCHWIFYWLMSNNFQQFLSTNICCYSSLLRHTTG